MHVLQWIATKAEDVEQAVDNVTQHLESQMSGNDSQATWYDWFVVGGGRWNTGEGDDFDEAYKDGKTNMVISSDNLAAFKERVDTCIEYRMAEFNRYREEWSNSAVSLSEYLDGYDGNMDYSMKLYPLGKMIDMVQGDWDYNSYFWDSESWSTNPMHMLKDINVGGMWYLVPVDFHF